MNLSNKLSWTLDSTVYHLYVRSFCDSNNDGIGDITGVIGKLEYIASLGVDTIWLSPIYPSPQIDFGYDISDYTAIDPIYGTLEDFDELVKKAHALGIKIMMDFVPNHTSDHHSWFRSSRSSKNNPKRDWYIWSDPKPNGSLPNNWISRFGGSGWEFDEVTKQYYFHSFDKHQPDLNWRNPEVVKAMLDILRFWLDRGVNGFRVDAIQFIFKDKLLRDEPLNPNYQPPQESYKSLLHIYSRALPEYKDMMEKYIEVLKEYNNIFLVTEVTMQVGELIDMYKTINWEYAAPFNFSFITLPWNAKTQKEFLDAYNHEINSKFMLNYVLGNHDKPRVASRIGREQARIAAMLQLTLRGMPFIYYGEEIGMTNTKIVNEKIQDTYERTSPGFGRDPERTPMQWNSQINAGFSDSSPWLPINENYKEINVEKEEQNSQSFLQLYKRLIKLKKSNPALREGIYVPITSQAQNVLAFMRKTPEQLILVLLNFDDKQKQVSLDYNYATLLCDTSLLPKENKKINLHQLSLNPNEGLIFLIEDK